MLKSREDIKAREHRETTLLFERRDNERNWQLLKEYLIGVAVVNALLFIAIAAYAVWR